MGNFADLLNTNNRRCTRKRIKLSKKSIRKRQAKGQKTSGYEEYDDTYYIHDRKKLEKIVEEMRARDSKITLAKLIKILDSKTEQEETYYFGW